MKHWLIVLCFAFTSGFSYSQKPHLISGKYEWLDIAFDDSSKYLTGFYSGKDGWNKETKSYDWDCQFFCEGSIKDDAIHIIVYSNRENLTDNEILDETNFEQGVKGKLQIKTDSSFLIEFNMALDAGCYRVLRGIESGGLRFNLSKRTNWKQIRIISEKTYFYSEPAEPRKTNSYLIKGDRIYVLKNRKDWVFAEFIGKTTTKGWINKKSLYKLKSEIK